MRTTLAVLILAGTLFAGDHASYSSGKLIDIQRRASAAGKIQGEYCMAVQVDDVYYLVEYVPFWRGSYVPTDMIIGDSIQVRTKGTDMMFVSGNGKSAKGKILRRERVKVGSDPISCAEQVQVQVRN